MRNRIPSRIRIAALGAAVLFIAAPTGSARALDFGDDLRGAVESDAAADWQTLASLDVGEDALRSEEELLDMMAAEDAGVPAPSEPRSSVRSLSLEEAETSDGADPGYDPSAPIRSADPATVTANLYGPARAPDFVPTIPNPSPSLAVLPRNTWGGGNKRASVSLLGAY